MCKRLGMVLLSLETVLEKKNLVATIGTSNSSYLDCRHMYVKHETVETVDVFWTSGSGEGVGCVEGKEFAWCSVGGVMGAETDLPALWFSPPEISTSRCMALKLDGSNNGLVFKDCAAKQKFICEVLKRFFKCAG